MSLYYKSEAVSLYLGDSLSLLRAQPSESVACVVSSPPYNVGMAYQGADNDRSDLVSWYEYERFANEIAAELWRVLLPAGRLWWNIQPAVPENSAYAGERRSLTYLWQDAFETHFHYRDTIAWVQDAWDAGCAWGSWLRPSAPNVRGRREDILLYYKGSGDDDLPIWKREPPSGLKGWQDAVDGPGGTWMDLCANVWTLGSARSKYPATFPIDLPRRAIRLSTWPGELVLDPFCGTATTLLAAQELNRLGVGFDRSEHMLAEGVRRLPAAELLPATHDEAVA